MLHSVYMGFIISKRAHAMRWESYAFNRFVYSDTLAGIKQLIRNVKGELAA